MYSDDQPFTVVEGEPLRRLFHLLRTDATPPSADTIKSNIMESYKQEKTKIQNTLQVLSFYFYLYFINIIIIINLFV